MIKTYEDFLLEKINENKYVKPVSTETSTEDSMISQEAEKILKRLGLFIPVSTEKTTKPVSTKKTTKPVSAETTTDDSMISQESEKILKRLGLLGRVPNRRTLSFEMFNFNNDIKNQ